MRLCEKSPSKARQGSRAGRAWGAAAKLVCDDAAAAGSNLNGAAFGHGEKELREGGATNATTFQPGCVIYLFMNIHI